MRARSLQAEEEGATEPIAIVDCADGRELHRMLEGAGLSVSIAVVVAAIALVPDLLAYWLSGELANERTNASTDPARSSSASAHCPRQRWTAPYSARQKPSM